MNGFNAFKYVGELREAGVPEKQAETHLRILHEIVESNLATKRDIKELEQKMELKMEQNTNELKRDIKELEQSTKRDIKELEQKMLIKLGALMVVTIGIIVALSNLNVA